MISSEKIIQLKLIIENNLAPLVDNDYVLLELPYYSNVGDLLIWKGEEFFLKNIQYNCLMKKSFHTFNFPALDKNVIILLQGGGNWGDVWTGKETPHYFRKEVVKAYPDNKIIVFPQTIHYDDMTNLSKDAELFSKHENLTICTRDLVSYNTIVENYRNHCLLLPDMAFCIPQSYIKRFEKAKTDKILFLQREDNELSQVDFSNMMDVNLRINKVLSIVLWHKKRFFPNIVIDLYFQQLHKDVLIKKGIKFISSYKKVYTTRLHVAILCILLGREFVFFDNSYGKNYNFYKQWLSDLETIKFLK